MAGDLAVEDCFEVLIASIFQDQGAEAAKKFIYENCLKVYQSLKQTDYKTIKVKTEDPKIQKEYDKLERLIERKFQNEFLMKEALKQYSPLGAPLRNLGKYFVKLTITTYLLQPKLGKFHVL